MIVLICIPFMAKDVEYFLRCFMAIFFIFCCEFSV